MAGSVMVSAAALLEQINAVNGLGVLAILIYMFVQARDIKHMRELLSNHVTETKAEIKEAKAEIREAKQETKAEFRALIERFDQLYALLLKDRNKK